VPSNSLSAPVLPVSTVYRRALLCEMASPHLN
jgi:hypothetical protein